MVALDYYYDETKRTIQGAIPDIVYDDPKDVGWLESTFIDQINPKRQTAGPHEGGLTGTGPRVVRLSPTLRMSH